MKNYLLFTLCASLLFASCSKDVLPTVTTSTPTFESNGITWQNGVPDFNYVLTMNGEVLSGGSKTKRGYVWATQPLPTELDNVVFDSASGNGAYRLKTKTFTFGETYFIRAFAENSMGRVYGEVQQITAPIKDDLLQALIGTTYGGGVIAYIDSSGHGLIAAPSDIGTAAWGCYGTAISGADGVAIGTGNQNTIDIFTQASNDAHRLIGKADDDTLLLIYSFYKQSTVGDNNTEKPSFFNFKAFFIKQLYLFFTVFSLRPIISLLI